MRCLPCAPCGGCLKRQGHHLLRARRTALGLRHDGEGKSPIPLPPPSAPRHHCPGTGHMLPGMVPFSGGHGRKQRTAWGPEIACPFASLGGPRTPYFWSRRCGDFLPSSTRTSSARYLPLRLFNPRPFPIACYVGYYGVTLDTPYTRSRSSRRCWRGTSEPDPKPNLACRAAACIPPPARRRLLSGHHHHRYAPPMPPPQGQSL